MNSTPIVTPDFNGVCFGAVRVLTDPHMPHFFEMHSLRRHRASCAVVGPRRFAPPVRVCKQAFASAAAAAADRASAADNGGSSKVGGGGVMPFPFAAAVSFAFDIAFFGASLAMGGGTTSVAVAADTRVAGTGPRLAGGVYLGLDAAVGLERLAGRGVAVGWAAEGGTAAFNVLGGAAEVAPKVFPDPRPADQRFGRPMALRWSLQVRCDGRVTFSARQLGTKAGPGAEVVAFEFQGPPALLQNATFAAFFVDADTAVHVSGININII